MSRETEPSHWRIRSESDTDRVWEEVGDNGEPTGNTEVESIIPIRSPEASLRPVEIHHQHHHHHWVLAAEAAILGAVAVEVLHLVGH